MSFLDVELGASELGSFHNKPFLSDAGVAGARDSTTWTRIRLSLVVSVSTMNAPNTCRTFFFAA